MARPDGPYPTIESDFWLRDGASGVFLLSSDGRKPDFLGISTADIKSDVRDLAQSQGKSFFLFYYSNAPARLFKIACEWFHKYELATNEEHPRPLGSTRQKCPVLNCEFSR